MWVTAAWRSRSNAKHNGSQVKKGKRVYLSRDGLTLTLMPLIFKWWSFHTLLRRVKMASVSHLRLIRWKNTTREKHLKVKLTKRTHFTKNLIIFKRKQKVNRKSKKVTNLNRKYNEEASQRVPRSIETIPCVKWETSHFLGSFQKISSRERPIDKAVSKALKTNTL